MKQLFLEEYIGFVSNKCIIGFCKFFILICISENVIETVGRTKSFRSYQLTILLGILYLSYITQQPNNKNIIQRQVKENINKFSFSLHRGTYTFPISKSEENVVMAMEGPPQPTRSSKVLDGKYSDPIDKASTSNETSGPRFCATKVGQNTNFQKPENGCEYQHLDFTLRSETSPYFAENSEYDHTRVNMVSVFNQPWDTASSKVNKLFSRISKSVVQKGQNVRKSLIQMRSDSPQLKCRASDNCDVKETQLDHQQFVLDSIVDNQRDKNIDVAHSIVADNKNDSEFKYAASKFAVLPFSERINVKSTHIYDEPNDKRLSLRERLKFGGPRKQSIIYSLATAIDDINESEA